MKAIQMQAPGGPEVLQLREVADPVPKAGEALVKVEAAGVNFIDVYYRKGQYKGDFPLIAGQEGAGSVVALGPGVTSVKVGDAVAWTGPLESYAELQAVPVDRLVKRPAGVSAKQGAAAMLQGMTAHYLATATYALKPGDTCLVHAASGGVGLLLCQLAKLRGARVIGTVSTAEKEQLAREAGADEIIRYTEQDFVAETKRLTGGKGLQVIYDSVGKTTFLPGLDLLALRGTMVLYGQSSGPVDPINPQILNQKGSLYLTRPTLHHYVHSREDLEHHAGAVFGLIRDGKLKMRISHELPLAEAAEAHRILEGRKSTGKVLLIP